MPSIKPGMYKRVGSKKSPPFVHRETRHKHEYMEKTPQIAKIEKLVAPAAEGMGYELVRVMLVGAGGGKPTLQIMAEKPDGTMTIEDCSRLSQALSAVLDVENAMNNGAYYLEVSSPGIDRPLTRLKDFERYKGFDARVEVEPAIEGQKKFKGKLTGASEDGIISLQTEDGLVHGFPFGQIHKAKLLLTDELIKAAQKKG